jgi:shikimate kinase
MVALIGLRQCGKTTMGRTFVSSASATYFDLEDPVATRCSSSR